MICPLLKTPFYGTCIQLSKNVSGLMVIVTFTIRILDDRSTSNLNASESDIGQKIYRAFSKSIGLKGAKCLICMMYVMRQTGTSATSPQLYLRAEVYTTSHCQFDRFIELVSGVLEKEIKATLPDKSSLTFRVGIDYIPFSQLLATFKTIFVSPSNVCFPGKVYQIEDRMFCPQIEIDHSEMSSFVEREGKSQRWLLKEGMIDEVSNGTIRICMDEYFALFEQTNSAVLLSLTVRRFIARHFLLGFIVYEYQKLLP